jgi:IS5 family transposase
LYHSVFDGKDNTFFLFYCRVKYKLRRTYARESKQLLRDTYNSKHPKRTQKARKRLKTIANCQLRDLDRKMDEHQKAFYKRWLELYKRAVNQQKHDKHKIYSLHKPFTECISKGKVHKQYESGNKVGLITSGKSGKKIITAIMGFIGNPYDGHTVEPLLNQMDNTDLKLPQELAYDRGGKGKKEIIGVKIIAPEKPKKSDTVYQKRQKRRKFRARAGIEPVIGHLKTDFRMAQNYLNGEKGVQINALMVARAWNMKKMMEKLKQEVLHFIFRLFFSKYLFSLAS